MRDKQRGFRRVQVVERSAQSFRLVRFERPFVHDGQLLLRELGRQRRTQRAQEHFLRQRIAVISWLGPMYRAAVPPKRRANGPNAGAARTLLSPELAARAAHFAL